MIVYYGRASRFDDAERSYLSLIEAIHGKKKNEKLSESVAEAFVNVINVLDPSQHSDKSTHYLSYLDRFGQENYHHIAVQRCLTMGIYNALRALPYPGNEDVLDEYIH